MKYMHLCKIEYIYNVGKCKHTHTHIYVYIYMYICIFIYIYKRVSERRKRGRERIKEKTTHLLVCPKYSKLRLLEGSIFFSDKCVWNKIFKLRITNINNHSWKSREREMDEDKKEREKERKWGRGRGSRWENLLLICWGVVCACSKDVSKLCIWLAFVERKLNLVSWNYIKKRIYICIIKWGCIILRNFHSLYVKRMAFKFEKAMLMFHLATSPNHPRFMFCALYLIVNFVTDRWLHMLSHKVVPNDHAWLTHSLK